MLSLRSWLAEILVFSYCGLTALAAEPGLTVSRAAPPPFEERLKPHLTSLETARGLPLSARQRDDESGVETLLDEKIVLVEEDGRDLTVSHEIHAVLTEAGIQNLGEASHHYRPSQDKIYLVLARTIRPDGSFVPIEDKGAFIKRAPNREPALHTDDEELRIVFPEVTPGVLIESIVVSETFRPSVEGTFLHGQVWGNFGPSRRIRLLVDLPETLRPQLRWQSLGFSLREPEASSPEAGRVLLHWSANRVPAPVFEPGAPPLRQTGPHLRMGTLASWDDFGKWFAGLLRMSEEDGPTLEAKAAEWTGEVSGPKDIAKKLHERVCSDIRYTGLEFGTGNYRPRKSVDVLATSYGDCKDKANLLRELLKRRGVSSRLALLDSTHTGVIDRTIPGPGRFTHAILAIDLPGEKEPLFCDPTVEGAPLGVLSPGDIDRDVLLVDETGKAEWKRTPVQSLGRQEGTFALEAEPGGGFSGWLTMKADGYLAAAISRAVARNNRAVALRELTTMYCLELKGGEIIDYELTKGKGPADDPGIEVRAFVLKKGAAIDGKAASEKLRFPAIGLVTPNAGPVAVRQTPIKGPLLDVRVTGTVRMPKDWKLVDLPSAFRREAAGFNASFEWKAAKSVLHCESKLTGTDPEISPADHSELWNLKRDLKAWLEDPAIVKRPAIAKEIDEDEDAQPWAPEPGSLPRMITAKGQLALIDARFPFDANNPFASDHEARRKALAKVLEFFPDDSFAQYQTGILSLASELFSFEEQGISERAKALIEKHRSQLDPDSLAAGELILATGLMAQDKKDEALPLALSVAENEGVNQRVRQGGALVAAMVLEDKDPARALDLARRGLEARFLPVLSVASGASVALHALARLPETQTDDLVKEWETIVRQHAAHAETLREFVVEMPDDWIDGGDLEGAEKMVAALDEIIKGTGFSEEGKKSVSQTRREIEQARSFEKTRGEFLEWLGHHPWPELEKVEKDDVLDLVSEVEDAMEDKPADVAFRYTLRRLVRYGLQPDFPSHLLEAATHAEDWLEDLSKGTENTPKPPANLEPLIDALVDSAEKAPGDEEDRREILGDAALLRGHIIRRRDGENAALAHYRKAAQKTSLADEQRGDARLAAAELLIQQKDYRGALAEWKAAEELDVDWKDDYVFGGIYVAIRVGEPAEAWRRIELTKDQGFDSGNDKADVQLKEEWSRLLANRADAERWWAQSATWWKDWEALCLRAKIPLDAKSAVLLPQHFTGDRLKQAASLRKEGKPALFARLLKDEVTKASCHRHLAPKVAKLLQTEAALQYPKLAGEFRALANKLEAGAVPVRKKP